MKINKNSWHYKFLEGMSTDYIMPDNILLYLYKLFCHLFFVIVLVTLAGSLTGMIVLGMFMNLYSIFLDLSLSSGSFWFFVFGSGFAGWTILFLLVIKRTHNKFSEKMKIDYYAEEEEDEDQ